MADPDGPLDRLVEVVLASPKYRCVSPDLIRSIGARELAKPRPLKEAIKATKNLLHQVGGAYHVQEIDYEAGLAEVRRAAQSSDREEWRRVCVRLMSHHASTRERLPILDELYTTLLSDLGPIHSVLDLACGLHPLSIPWMPLAADAEYYACDIYADMVSFLNGVFEMLPCRGGAQVVDVTQSCPTQKVEVAFLLKSLPCLEQIDRSAGLRLLDAIHADHLLVSFPIHSLGGRQKGMLAHYEAHFQELIAARSWTVQRFAFATELVFRVTK